MSSMVFISKFELENLVNELHFQEVVRSNESKKPFFRGVMGWIQAERVTSIR